MSAARHHGPDAYWSPELPPSRGQLATIAVLALELLGVEEPASRLDASVAITRLRTALDHDDAPRPVRQVEDFCYALDLAAKFKGWGQARYQRDGGKASGPGFGVTLHPDKLDEPLRWRKPRMVFVNSMSDLFHEDIPDEYIAQVFGTMAAAPQHTFQVLTKRPERMAALLGEPVGSPFWTAVWAHAAAVADDRPSPVLVLDDRFVLTNVWLGTSIENRRFVGRADVLRETPAAVRFVSAEPLLGPLIHDAPYRRHALNHREARARLGACWVDGYLGPQLDLTDIDWLIVGGESGLQHRPVDPQWVRDLRDACEHTDTAFFFKQWGGHRPTSGGRLLDGRTWDEMPQGREVAAA